MTLTDELVSRLPADYCAAAIWHAADRHGIPLLLTDDFEQRCNDAMASHLAMVAGWDADQTRLLMTTSGDGLPALVAVCAESFIAHLRCRGESMECYPDWVA